MTCCVFRKKLGWHQLALMLSAGVWEIMSFREEGAEHCHLEFYAQLFSDLLVFLRQVRTGISMSPLALFKCWQLIPKFKNIVQAK